MRTAFMMKGYKIGIPKQAGGHSVPPESAKTGPEADEPPLLLSLLFLSSPPYE